MSSSAVAPTAPGPWTQFRSAGRTLRLLLIGVGALTALLVVGEAVHLYRIAAQVHPAGGLLAILLVAGCVALVALPLLRLVRVPGVIRPPALPAVGERELSHLQAEVRYLERYLQASAANPELAPRAADVGAAQTGLKELGRRLEGARPEQVGELQQSLQAWTTQTMVPLLADVDRKADRVIYQEALTVGAATAASPNGVLDAFVMLWRAVHLVSRVSILYYGRPGITGTALICKDVLIATALAGFLQNVTDTLGGLVAKAVGGVTGVVAGPVVEGLTNALVMVRIGYLARERCRSFRRWDEDSRRGALATALQATQEVTVKLGAELVRTIGTGLGAVAGVAASGVASVAESIGRSLSSLLRGKPPGEDPPPADQSKNT